MRNSGASRQAPDSQSRRTRSAALPRWIAILFALSIALILWLGVASDPHGHWSAPNGGSILYLVAVIGVAAFLARKDRDS